MFKVFKKSKSSVLLDDPVSSLDEERSVNHRSPVEPSKSSSEPSVPPEVYQHLTHVLRGLVEAYTKNTFGTDSKEATRVSYSLDDKFFEPFAKEYYENLLRVFHPEDIRLMCSILMRTEFVMFEQALKTITSIHSKELLDMCEKATGFDTEEGTLH